VLVQFHLTSPACELCLTGTSDSVVGGALLARPLSSGVWFERNLAPLAYQLMRCLCVQAIREAELPSRVRGCISTRELARQLPFHSKQPDDENVRQVVRRLRVMLHELNADGVLAVAPGRGYYLACRVNVVISRENHVNNREGAQGVDSIEPWQRSA
jgi:hypothetical protein